jgi:type VI secretion system protein ImpB
MPTIESTQHKLDRIRPPRVQITYDVEIGGAIEKVDLPLVVGILADLSGDTSNGNRGDLKDRKFVEIDRDNFNAILRSIQPTLKLSVPKKIPNDDGTMPKEDEKLSVTLTFSHISDCKPLSIVKQVPELNRLFEERQCLRDLLAKLDGNDKLKKQLLDQIVNATESM